MKTPKLKIELSDNFLTKSIFSTDINIFPSPLVIYIPLTQEFFLNDLAYNELDIPKDEVINMRDFISSNQHLLKIDTDNSTHKFKDNTTINLFNKRTYHIKFNFNVSKDDVLGHIYFITFEKVELKSSVNTLYSLSMVKEEISKLRSNLNFEGKEKLEYILKEYFDDDSKQHLSLEELVNYEKQIKIIQKNFTVLSRREVIICTLLLNNLELTDIAKTINRSINSIFVIVHRINRKLDIPNKDELVRRLREVMDNEPKG